MSGLLVVSIKLSAELKRVSLIFRGEHQLTPDCKESVYRTRLTQLNTTCLGKGCW